MGVNDNTLADTFSNYLTTSVLTLSSVSTADNNMQLTCRESANTLDSNAATLSIYSEFEHVKSVSGIPPRLFDLVAAAWI